MINPLVVYIRNHTLNAVVARSRCQRVEAQQLRCCQVRAKSHAPTVPAVDDTIVCRDLCCCCTDEETPNKWHSSTRTPPFHCHTRTYSSHARDGHVCA